MGSHLLTVDKVTADSATITVASSPQTITLKVGESKTVDLDEDKVSDLKITLIAVDMKTNFADLTLTLLTMASSKVDKIISAKKETMAGKFWIFGVSVLAVLIAIVVYLFITRRKPEK